MLLVSIFLFPPDLSLKLSLITIPLYAALFIVAFLFLYSLTAYLTRSFIHGILIGLFPVVYLIMRLNELTNPLFFVLLAGIFVGLELLLVQLTSKKTS
jgi:hypothetical protein